MTFSRPLDKLKVPWQSLMSVRPSDQMKANVDLVLQLAQKIHNFGGWSKPLDGSLMWDSKTGWMMQAVLDAFLPQRLLHGLEHILFLLCLSTAVSIDVNSSVFKEDLLNFPGPAEHLFFVFKVKEFGYQRPGFVWGFAEAMASLNDNRSVKHDRVKDLWNNRKQQHPAPPTFQVCWRFVYYFSCSYPQGHPVCLSRTATPSPSCQSAWERHQGCPH